MRICFDVDGVLCDDSDSSIPYDERQPYPWVGAFLKELKAQGHEIIIQTARFMTKFDGNQAKATAYGLADLRRWLQAHELPYDEVYMGKCSAHIYVDDRACRVNSNYGPDEWKALCQLTTTAATHAASPTRK